MFLFKKIVPLFIFPVPLCLELLLAVWLSCGFPGGKGPGRSW